MSVMKILFLLFISLFSVLFVVENETTQNSHKYNDIYNDIYNETHDDTLRFNDSIASSLKLSGHGVLDKYSVISSGDSGPLQLLYKYILRHKASEPWKHLDFIRKNRYKHIEIAPYSFGTVGRLTYNFSSFYTKSKGSKTQTLIACQCLNNIEDEKALDQCNQAILIRPVLIKNNDESTSSTCIYEKINTSRGEKYSPCYSELLRTNVSSMNGFRAPSNVLNSSQVKLSYTYFSKDENHNHWWKEKTVRPWIWSCTENEIKKIKKVSLKDLLKETQDEANPDHWSYKYSDVQQKWNSNINISCLQDHPNWPENVNEFRRLDETEGPLCYNLSVLARSGALFKAIESQLFTYSEENNPFRNEKPKFKSFVDIYLLTTTFFIYIYRLFKSRPPCVQPSPKENCDTIDILMDLGHEILVTFEIFLITFISITTITTKENIIQLDASLAYAAQKKIEKYQDPQDQSVAGSVIVASAASGVVYHDIPWIKIFFCCLLTLLQWISMLFNHKKDHTCVEGAVQHRLLSLILMTMFSLICFLFGPPQHLCAFSIIIMFMIITIIASVLHVIAQRNPWNLQYKVPKIFPSEPSLCKRIIGFIFIVIISCCLVAYRVYNLN